MYGMETPLFVLPKHQINAGISKAEVYQMDRIFRNVCMLLISGALTVPATISARSFAMPQSEKQAHEDKGRAEKVEKAAKAEKKLRVYDAKHRDYHDWNENEDRAYHSYMNEKHEDYRDYDKLTREKQTEYWEWRHDHPDEDARRDRDRR